MKISENILVGIKMPSYCEFYSNIKIFIDSFNEKMNKEFKQYFNDEYTLIGLVITHDDICVYEYYYIQFDNKIYKYGYKVSIKNRSLIWFDTIIVTEDVYLKDIREQKYVYNVDDYIKKN